MIQAQELRIGNNAIVGTSVVIIHRVSQSEVVVDFGEDAEYEILTPDDLSPIAITPEILEACGFDYHGDEYWLPFCREYDDKTCHLIVGRLVDDPPGMYYFSVKVPSGTAAINNVYHLHQVQNIAHSLTGKELTYSPNTTVK